jgi:hypothetical protein
MEWGNKFSIIFLFFFWPSGYKNNYFLNSICIWNKMYYTQEYSIRLKFKIKMDSRKVFKCLNIFFIEVMVQMAQF